MSGWPGARWLLRLGTAVTLAFLYVPLVVIGLYAFNASRIQSYLAQRLTTDPVQAAAPGGGGDKVAAAPVP